jgi:hypothetical protein
MHISEWVTLIGQVRGGMKGGEGDEEREEREERRDKRENRREIDRKIDREGEIEKDEREGGREERIDDDVQAPEAGDCVERHPRTATRELKLDDCPDGPSDCVKKRAIHLKSQEWRCLRRKAFRFLSQVRGSTGAVIDNIYTFGWSNPASVCAARRSHNRISCEFMPYITSTLDPNPQSHLS